MPSNQGCIKVLFLRPWIASFIETDLELLRRYFDVRVIEPVLNRKNPRHTFITVFNMVKGIIWADLTFSWFAGAHATLAALFSKIFRKKSVVVAGGGDAVKMPEINYGFALHSIGKYFPLGTYLLSNRILAFSESSKTSILDNYTARAKVEVVYLGIDTAQFTPKGLKENLAITVSNVSYPNLKRKGLETFVKAAEYMTHTRFVLIGEPCDDSIDYLKNIKPQNVELIGYLSDKELLEYYQKAKVYVQVSAHEGFGVAMAEAMSCECVPVVTERGAIPEVVGNTGFYVPFDNPQATAQAVEEALKSDKGKMARERIISNYSLPKREAALIRTMSEFS